MTARSKPLGACTRIPSTTGAFAAKGSSTSRASLLFWKAGYAGPLGIEVLSEDLSQKPLEELVKRSYNTTIAQFAAE
jgi:hypothetical protein